MARGMPRAKGRKGGRQQVSSWGLRGKPKGKQGQEGKEGKQSVEYVTDTWCSFFVEMAEQILSCTCRLGKRGTGTISHMKGCQTPITLSMCS